MTLGETRSRKVRLLVLASTYPRWRDDPEPGFVHELTRRLVDRFEVTVLCPHAAGTAVREEMDGVRVVRYRYAPARLETLVNGGGIVTNLRRAKWKLLLVPGFLVAQWWCAQRLVRAEAVDLIHAHWIVPQGLVAVFAACSSGRRRVPFVVTSHGADLFALRSRLARWIKCFVVRRAVATTVVSEGMRDPMLALRADPTRLSIEPMGVDLLGRFTPDVRVERSRDEILFVGRLVEKKGLRHLIDAIPTVLQHRPAAFLTVAGFGPELEERQQQATRLGIENRVHFIGAVKQAHLPALYRRAAVLVAPFVEAVGGDQDGLGLVLLEAAGCGCPVIATELPATRNLRGISPLIDVVTWRNASELAETITSVRSPGRNADTLRKFDWTTRADAYAAILSDAAT